MNTNTDSVTGNTPLPNPYSSSTILSWGKIAINLAAIPALPVMLLLRKPCIGFRRVKLTYLYLIAAAIAALAILTSNGLLSAYAVAVLVIGYVHNIKAWRLLCTGSEDHHTYDDGISWFTQLPLPEFLYGEERIYRFLDPLAGGLIAALLFMIPGARPLAMVIAFATVFLAVHAQAGYEYRLNILLDTNDAQVDALGQLSLVKRRNPGSKAMNRTIEAGMSPISTGIGDDIREQIERRKARAVESDVQVIPSTVSTGGITPAFQRPTPSSPVNALSDNLIS